MSSVQWSFISGSLVTLMIDYLRSIFLKLIKNKLRAFRWAQNPHGPNLWEYIKSLSESITKIIWLFDKDD